jgi:hypothetical protein
MIETQTVELVSLIGGSTVVGSVATKAFDWFADRKANKKILKRAESEAGKFDAEALQAITTAAVTLVAPLQQEVTELRGRVETLETENGLTNSRLALAIEHIRALRTWIGQHIQDKSPPAPPADLGL